MTAYKHNLQTETFFGRADVTFTSDAAELVIHLTFVGTPAQMVKGNITLLDHSDLSMCGLVMNDFKLFKTTGVKTTQYCLATNNTCFAINDVTFGQPGSCLAICLADKERSLPRSGLIEMIHTYTLITVEVTPKKTLKVSCHCDLTAGDILKKPFFKKFDNPQFQRFGKYS